MNDNQSLELISQEFAKDQSRPKFKPPWPVTSNWASKLAHPCERWLYYNRTAWDKREQRDWKGIGRLGNVIHDLWKMDRMADGYTVIQHEMPLSKTLRDVHQIAGKIDGRIGKGDIRPVLYEFKSMNEFDYARINTYDDILNHSKEYIRSYIGQIQIYLHDNQEAHGIFVLCNKANLDWKWIRVNLNLPYVEELLERAKRINDAVETHEPPKRIPYGKICERCDFKMVCLPDIINDGYPLIDDQYLERLVEERETLRLSHFRYEELDDEAKSIAKIAGRDFILGTNWKVAITKTETKKIETKLIPPEERAKYEVTKERVRVDFIPIGQAKI